MWASWSDSLHVFTGSHGYFKLGRSGEVSLVEMGFEGRAPMSVLESGKENFPRLQCGVVKEREAGACVIKVVAMYSISSQQPGKMSMMSTGGRSIIKISGEPWC